ncbi:MAG: glycosyl hydrolase family 17 protein [Gammaproteobacteria bacterium]|nr:glycosyl hydrolase family 17 protein [Gammaproteobacteria bacterium]
MSNAYQRRLSLTGVKTAELNENQLRSLVKNIFESGIHGLCFSPYIDGQGPGTRIDEAQVRGRLATVKPFTRWVRTFSCTQGHELIPGIAAEAGLKSMVGIWLDGDLDNNEQELANAAEIVRSGHAGILAVGNEVLLRGDLSEQQLLEYINRAKAFSSGTPVGYVDAYFEFENHPAITDACDVLLANCYPFWEGCPAEFSILYMKDMYRRALRVAGGKPVIVSETGWPNRGSATDGAIPGFENAIKYLVDTYRWAEEDDVDVFYFSAFDEAWKVGAEGDVGAYWGLWDKDGQPKYGAD